MGNMLKTPLCELFEKYGSDKCESIFHTYSKYYYAITEQISVNNVLEIGVGTKNIMAPIVGQGYIEGASLKAWRDFFPKATIYGLDIDTSVLFEDTRIKCYFVDQSNVKSIMTTVDQIFNDNNISTFDIIIDDGSHISQHQLCSLNVLSKFVSVGGVYIIEDIQDNELQIFTKNIPLGFKILCMYSGNHKKSKTQDNFIAYKRVL
jgi:hypothetical protein